MNIYFIGLFITISLQASFIDELNHVRADRGAAPVTALLPLNEFLKRFIIAREMISEHLRRQVTLSDSLGDVCGAFPGATDCVKDPGVSFLYDSQIAILSIPNDSNSTKEIEYIIKNKENSYLANGDVTNPIYKTIGEYVRDNVHYAVLSPYPKHSKR